MYGKVKIDMREIIKTLCKYKKVEIIEGAVCDTTNILKYLIECYCSAIFIRRRYFTEGPGRSESPVDSAESKLLQY